LKLNDRVGEESGRVEAKDASLLIAKLIIYQKAVIDHELIAKILTSFSLVSGL
jgi:hypothetical protein